MTARNPSAVQRALYQRVEIRRIWLECVQREPFERHTAKSIGRLLPFRLARSTVAWHMEQIRLEAAQAQTVAKDQHIANVSSPPPAP
jgi:hypothetical protein